jgi:3-oxoacyl-[acyl-carrier protein] reductase
LPARNTNVLDVKCDVSVSSQVNSVIRSTAEKFGSETIDILVNNAGVAFNKRLMDTSEQEWDQTINTNLKGSFLFARQFFFIWLNESQES